mmetsp:Transcript_50015/g.88097  ORF Transcript_50015/g.88097 Transcript_50015/m.88097 type:complete len:507 (+) Transcript_50015:76-1596(+)
MHSSRLPCDGEQVAVFSETASAWVIGQVDWPVHHDLVTVKYMVGNAHCRKHLHPDSEHMRLLRSHRTACSESDTEMEEFDPAAVQFQGDRDDVVPPGYDAKDFYTSHRKLQELLDNNDVALIDGEWLLTYSCTPGNKLPMRQDLPPDALVNPDTLFKSWHEDAPKEKRIRIVSLSHCWWTQDHPDPDGWQLRFLAPFIDAFLKDMQKEGAPTFAFYCSWCSQWQKKGGARSPEHAESWERAVKFMDLWYTHIYTRVWILPHVPNDAENPRPYKERGWPTWESACSLFLGGVKALDLSLFDKQRARKKLPKAYKVSWRVVTEWCRCRVTVPLEPDEFDQEIAQKVFTQGQIDRDKVKNNYRQTYYRAISVVDRLYFSQAGSFDHLPWTSDDVDKLIKVLSLCSPNLDRLNLDFCKVASPDVERIAKELSRFKELKDISLILCDILDPAAMAIAKAVEALPGLCKLRLQIDQVSDRVRENLTASCAKQALFQEKPRNEYVLAFKRPKE